ncbi:hypothetical protein Bca52824_074516 [Brassica carinata]|uniref:Uncharacterized protein n=1 Tax=Brassica carinata TaxID=52824 RepID=A0A8X7PR19_BRACI|nr:hypothetical protein Bca52824_074516 [Brassica carinata]
MKTCSLFKTAAAASAVTVMAGSGAMLANSFKSRREMQEYLWGLVADARRYCSTDMTMVITEVCGDQPNKVFQDAKVYISKHVSTRMSSSIRVFKHEKDVNLTFTVEEEDNVFTHTFQGVELRWVLHCHQIDGTKFRYYELTFPKKAKEMVIRSYLPFVSREAARQRVKTRKLFYIDGAEKWTSVTFNHPSTWIALWRKTLLMETTNTSILLVEDIDCLPEFKKMSFKQVDETKATLSGFLDFMDRGCSNCGDQRIIVFTATNKEKPGSAFLRARGIDVHIHMPYCTPDAFEILASNYLNITTHKLFSEIKESILQTEVTRC